MRGARSWLVRGPLPVGDLCDIIGGYRGNFDGVCRKTVDAYARCLTVLPDGRLVSGTQEGPLHVWDSELDAVMLTLQGHTAHATEIVALPDGKLASSSVDLTVRVWDMVRGLCTLTMRHYAPVFALGLLPDGNLISAGHDDAVRVWASDGHPKLVKKIANVMSMAVTSEGIALGVPGGVKLWSMDMTACFKTLGFSGIAVPIVPLPDGKMAVSVRMDIHIVTWNDPERVTMHDGHCVDGLTPLGGGLLASCSRDNTVKVWDYRTGECLFILKEHTRAVLTMAMWPDGRVASCSMDRTIRVWE